jgi:hypothetical protein
MTGFKKVNGQQAAANPRNAFGRPTPQQASAQQRGMYADERTPPSAYINLYLPLANGERAKLGDKGIPLTLDNPVHAKLLDYIENHGLTGDDLAQLLVIEIGKPRDPNAEIDFDFSRLGHTEETGE